MYLGMTSYEYVFHVYNLLDMFVINAVNMSVH